MAQITQIELLRQFLEEGLEKGDAGNGHVRKNKYYHYETPILERYGNKYILNRTRYSIITWQIQKRMKAAIPEDKLITVGKVPEAYKGSLKDFLTKE